MPTLMTLIASTRPGRAGKPIGDWFAARAAAHGGFTQRVVDLAELNLPLLDEPKHPRLQDYAHEHTRQWSALVAEADAFVFVHPEYNYAITAPLKNAIDYLFHEWAYKPLGFVSYGGVSAGQRAQQQIRQVASALRLYPTGAAGVAIPFFHQHLKDGRFVADAPMDEAVSAMLDELLALEQALRPLRRPA